MAELERAVAVGRVTPSSARLWARSPGGGQHELVLWLSSASPGSGARFNFDAGDNTERDHTFTIDYPNRFPGARPLEPVTRYRFRILRRGELVGEGQFETPPAKQSQMPARFAIGLASCHQPFDEDGTLHEAGRRMLRVAKTAWERSGVKKVMWVGDQLYVDYPPSQSLFDADYFKTVGPPGRASLLECTREEAQAVYHARYRRNWVQPEWLSLLAGFPSYPILDDHEVIDNFGSLPEHHEEKFKHLRQAAGAAYRHYQHSRVEDSPADHDGPYDYAFEYGAAQGYVLDVRSMRRSADGNHARIFAPHQLDRFREWLNANAHAPVLFVVVSVPIFFMPGWASRLARRVPVGSFREDAHDRWMHPQYREDRQRLLDSLREHQLRNPRQKVVLLSGDVHVGYASVCDWRSEPPAALYQIVSSSITHKLSSVDWHLARHIPRIHFLVVDVSERYGRIHLLGGRLARLLEQPVGGLNVGVIDVDLSKGDALLNFKLFGEDAETPDEPKLLFESGFL